MASSLLDRVKRPPPPQSAETFIADADAAPITQKPTESVAATIDRGAEIPSAKAEGVRARNTANEDPRKREVPRYTFNLRLNDYELELLRTLAEEQRESMQKIVKSGLIPYLEGLRSKQLRG